MSKHSQNEVRNIMSDQLFVDKYQRMSNKIKKIITEEGTCNGLDITNTVLSSEMKLKLKINNLILEIRELISKCPPLQLLDYCKFKRRFSMLNVTSEYQMSTENEFKSRALEYVQSVIASTYITPSIDNNEFKSYREIIINKIVELYENSFLYYSFYSEKLRRTKEIFGNKSYDDIFYTCIKWYCRGKRYSFFDIPYLDNMLSPHDELIYRKFGINARDIINGLKNIQQSILLELPRKGLQLHNILREMSENKLDEYEIIDKYPDIDRLIGSVVGESKDYDLFDLSIITNWPETLLKELSWNVGECKSFFEDSQYPGWLSEDMPIIKKPFICIEGKYYCFDYDNVFDNFYRVVQKAIVSKQPDYVEQWNKVQKSTSESFPISLLCKLLNGCQYHLENYYKKVGSKKQWCENDAIIIYDDNLIIVEVKAGSYIYKSALTDMEGHFKAQKLLLEAPSSQSERFLDYLKCEESVKIFDENHNVKASLSLSDFREVTKICIMVDEIDEFAARAEKVNFLEIKSDTVFISINDLFMYSHFFDSAIQFLHFLKERKKATLARNISLNDEFDHLGMYLKHNTYSLVAEKQGNDKRFRWLGYREDIDNYYNQLVFEENDIIKKPTQEVPARLLEIIKILDNTSLSGSCFVGRTLLDMEFQMRLKFGKNINKFLQMKEPILYKFTIGMCSCYLICHNSAIENVPLEFYNNYILSSMLKNNDSIAIGLNLFYNKYSELIDIDFSILNPKQMPKGNKDIVSNLSAANCKLKVYEEPVKGKNKIKFGRNEKCPCGSGKKYKKCCGK
ncbi:MAG: SEC-C metal-binding domain-containing protein [Anaeromicrobium sp.]|jgi:hypothetical protein|uniref:SEC-C metal-binding domain-containing protein n=1 Tax=Anaeromicrobium sp. TaxID=1929132 RepID=UPI0025DB5ABC|nr:SEC-C metal-binding domain-containing protein [Anaeromicrobium sp.]MCT4592816.1 SEC-C metal-binding domain-containing protein [Anaeromicrobium sp.]